MFKNKIAVRLASVFVALVILCVSILGLLFINIFAKNHIKYRTDSLIKTAKQISYMTEVNSIKLQSENKVLEVLDYSADARIWIVDKNMNIVIRSNGYLNEHENMGNCLLPQNDLDFMQGVLSGKERISENNFDFYDVAMLSVGVPIYSNNEIVGAVLLHSSIDSLGAPIKQTAWYLFIAILVSTIIIIIFAGLYAVSFTKPLKVMKDVAGEMIDGNYMVKTNIKEKDEIGQLANSMDILAARLEEARNESVKLDKIRRDFVANVSHEFRTPLTVIKGNIETLIDTNVTDIKAYYSNILKEVNALEKLVSDLLDLSRIEEGRLELNIEQIDANSVISDVVRSITSIAGQKGITIDTRGVLNVIPPIYSDYYRLRQILLIFLSNGIKYSDNNKRISITTEIKDSLSIIIKDQGFGISESDLQYVWDRFFKADKMRTDNTSTGLGLSIAKNLVNLLGGEVSIESKLGFGTTVRITLPIRKEM